ncbi:hypothetical protein RHO12_02200 [Orbus sturtevantii]|uniref:hypothetical protein n=1 Tax=Orbus sturtevantii TaxID=3074109 RepID=UPI00370D3306
MELFFAIFFSFPVIIFSTLLTLCVLYWLVAAIGILHIDCLDVDFDGIDASPSTGLGGLLLKWGFNEVPMTLIITLISLFGWIFSYLCLRYILIHFITISWLYYLAGIIIFTISFIIATYLTAKVIKPIRPFFNKMGSLNSHKTLLGQVVVIRSSVVNEQKGEAFYEDGGAGLILQVRADSRYLFQRGDKAVLLSYDSVSNSYEIINESDFMENIK